SREGVYVGRHKLTSDTLASFLRSPSLGFSRLGSGFG
ncbi:hypothetical protein ABIA31_008687, partial [Catenulispora sp. MAP5-51]